MMRLGGGAKPGAAGGHVRRNCRSIRYPLQPRAPTALLRQCHYTTTPTASIMANITTTISAEFSIQATELDAGGEAALIRIV